MYWGWKGMCIGMESSVELDNVSIIEKYCDRKSLKIGSGKSQTEAKISQK
jgi:hypothetical protein